jgi:hypothetical protein
LASLFVREWPPLFSSLSCRMTDLYLFFINEIGTILCPFVQKKKYIYGCIMGGCRFILFKYLKIWFLKRFSRFHGYGGLHQIFSHQSNLSYSIYTCSSKKNMNILAN